MVCLNFVCLVLYFVFEFPFHIAIFTFYSYSEDYFIENVFIIAFVID